MKKIFLIMIFLVTIIMVVFLNIKKKNENVNDKKRNEFQSVIQNGIGLLALQNLQNIRVDEYSLLKKIKEKNFLQNKDLSSIRNKLGDDPFVRLADRKDFVVGINIEKKNILDAIGKDFNGNFYDVRNTSGSFGAWNDILVKSLYCDKADFDDQDFFILKLMHRQDGGYLDTHFLLALLLLKENGCYRQASIMEEINAVSNDIIKAETEDEVFSDLYVERIVFLYWAGYGNSIKKEWIDLIKNNFSKEIGWTDKNKDRFSVHVTGLALLSLIYYTEGSNMQQVY